MRAWLKLRYGFRAALIPGPGLRHIIFNIFGHCFLHFPESLASGSARLDNRFEDFAGVARKKNTRTNTDQKDDESIVHEFWSSLRD
jgi:hypothetical protein